ncbi:MAG TPA: hypothetical protein DCS93_16920 [Microscillaceae bacterium]|nr:hypothetical protein [Microscillaceae bacterium]
MGDSDGKSATEIQHVEVYLQFKKKDAWKMRKWRHFEMYDVAFRGKCVKPEIILFGGKSEN